MIHNTPGTYALVLSCAHSESLAVGRLGKMDLQPGFYIYVGSAFGPGGLGSRLSHHLSRVTAPHWHIDYLRQATELVEIWVTEDPKKREHEWAWALASCLDASLPLPRFGASDCRCPAHLFYYPVRPSLDWFMQRLGKLPYDIQEHSVTLATDTLQRIEKKNRMRQAFRNLLR